MMLIRVVEPGRPQFQLKRGEEGISVFDPDAVTPPLSNEEILDCFRPGSALVERSVDEIERAGLVITPIEGTDPLTERLRATHAEIRPKAGMTRKEFKQALKELE